MRGILLLMLGLCATAARADGEVYRYVDADGVVHYTDRAPDRHAKPLRLRSGVTAPGAGRKTFYSPEALRQAARFAVRVESPTPGERIGGAVPAIAAASVMPALVQGFRLVYQIDGHAATAAPVDALSIPLAPLPAGDHELVIILLDPHGRELARSPPSNFRVAGLKLAGGAPE